MDTSEHAHHHDKSNYTPLVVVLGLITAVAAVTASAHGLYTFVLYFMSGFFLVFGGFKLLNLKQFVDGYARYDLLAKRWRSYGYIYPAIELAFGFSMLAGFHPNWLLWTEVAFMLFGAIGVLLSMRAKSDIRCACLGSILDVPLSSVTLIEDFGMMALAIVLIVW